jgi:hypothetical protein
MSAQQQRLKDVAESYHLLLELLTSEPFMQECLQLIENMCLSRELTFTVAGKAPSAEFKAFINKYYYQFLKNAIRQAQGLGFVVWCVRKTPNGDKYPEVLPLGTFTWTVEADTSGHRSLKYRIQMSIKEVPFTVTEWIQPGFKINENSILHATVQTPLAHLIEEYRILRETIRRFHNADAWNSVARVIVSSEPKQFNHEASQKEVFETLDFLKGAIETKKRHTLSAVEQVFSNNPSNHREMVYELPPHHHIEPTPVLKPIVDIEYMTPKFRHSVCGLLGIPAEMVGADRSTQRESRGGRATSRMFQSKMARMCMFLSELMGEAHRLIYREEAEYNLIALPRMEVQGIEDLKILHEIGVLQPDHALRLSEVLLGATATQKKSGEELKDGRRAKRLKDESLY